MFVFNSEVFMAKPKIEKDEVDVQKLVREYWQTVKQEAEENEKSD